MAFDQRPVDRPTTSPDAPATLRQGLRRLALPGIERFDLWAGRTLNADQALRSRPLDIPADRFLSSLDLIDTWSPWMQPAIMVAAARSALDQTNEPGRRLAALMVVDRLASPLGLRDPSAPHQTPRNLDAMTLAGQVHDAWDQIADLDNSEGLGLTNVQLWNEALSTVRGNFRRYQDASSIRLSRAARRNLDPTAQQEVQAALLPATQEPPGDEATLTERLAYERATEAIPYLTGGVPVDTTPGPGGPPRGRRLVERSLETLFGRRDKQEGISVAVPRQPGAVEHRVGVGPLDYHWTSRPDEQPTATDLVRDYVRDLRGASGTGSYADQVRQRASEEQGREILGFRAGIGPFKGLFGGSGEDSGVEVPDAEYNPRASLVENAAARQVQLGGIDASIVSNLDDWNTKIVRGVGIGLSFPYQGLQAMYRNFRSSWNPLVNSEGDISFDDQTDLGQIVHALTEGRPVDTGSGFFVDPDSDIAEARYAAEVAGGTQGGHVTTLGRDVAQNLTWFEPDTLPWDVLSGSIDAWAALSLDPMNVAADEGSAAIRQAAGLLDGGAMSFDDAARWLGGEQAREVAGAISRVGSTNAIGEAIEGGRDPLQVYRAWRDTARSGGQRIPLPIWLRMMDGEVGDADHVLGVLSDTLGTSLRQTPRAPQEYISRRLPGRWRSEMPSRSGFNVEDPERAILEVERLGQMYDLPEETIADFVLRAGRMYRPREVTVSVDEIDPAVSDIRKILRGIAGEGPLPDELSGLDDFDLEMLANDLEAELEGALTPITRRSAVHDPDMEGWFSLMEDLAGDGKGALVQHGVPEGVASGLTRIWRHYHQSEGRYLVSEVGEGIRTRAVFSDGELVATRADPHLDVERFSGHIPGPDVRRIRRLTAHPLVRAATTAGWTPGRVRLARIGDRLEAASDLPEIRRLRAAAAKARFDGEARLARDLERQANELADVPFLRDPVERTRRTVAGMLDFNPAPGAPRLPIAAMDWLQEALWKPSVLLRLAWPLRVIGEEQLRMGASGLESAFHDPLSYIAWAIGRKGAEDITGTPLDEWQRFSEALSTRSGGWIDSMRWRRTGEWRTFRLGEEGHDRAWAEELAKLSASRVAQRLTGDASTDDIISELWDGSLRSWREELARGDQALNMRRAPGEPSYYDRFYAAEESGSTNVPVLSLDDWVESIDVRLRAATGDYQPELVEAVRTGRMTVTTRAGTRVVDINEPGTARLERAFLAQLSKMAPDHGPAAVAGPVITAERANRGEVIVDSMFAALMGHPTNRLSRAPAFKQFYWSRAEEMIGFATPSAQRQIIAQAAASGIDASALAAMKRAAREGRGLLGLEEIDFIAKGHALDDVKWLLYDLNEKSNFFDAARLIFPFGEAWKEVISRWSTIAPRNLRVPLVAYKGLREANRNTAVYRHEATVTDALDRVIPDWATPGHDTPLEVSPYEDGRGFFWQNQWGEQVFVYPGTAWLSDRLIGVPIPAFGRAQGLSLATEVLPGFGLVVQLPAQALLEAFPGWGDAKTPLGQSFRDLLLPFGADSSWWQTIAPPAWRSVQSGVAGLRNVHPWLRPLANAALWLEDSPDSNRAWAATTADVARYLASTGEYPVDDPVAQEQLWREASRRAAPFFLIQAVGKFAFPSSPSPDWLARDTNGRLVRVDYLSQEWQAALQAHQGDYYGAVQAFFDAHGEDNHLILQPKSMEVTMNVPLDPVGYAWLADHGSLVNRYPETFGFLAPEPDLEIIDGGDTDLEAGSTVSAAEFRRANARAIADGRDPARGDPPFSSEAWTSALAHGYREPLDTSDMAVLDQTRMLQLRMYQAEQILRERNGGDDLTSEQEDALSRLRDQLRSELYPEAFNFVGMTQRVDNQMRQDLVGDLGDGEVDDNAQLRRQVNDPDIDEDYRTGLAELLALWDRTNQAAAADGYSTFYEAQDYADARRVWRYQIAPELIDQYPRLAGLWTFVFDPLLDREGD